MIRKQNNFPDPAVFNPDRALPLYILLIICQFGTQIVIYA